jgi:FecR-like protein
MPHRTVAILVSALTVFLTAATAQAATKVGVAAAVKNDVQRGGQPLATGADVFTNERIRTGEASIAQILLLDKTALTVGPRSEVTLDRFVYDPAKGQGQVVVNAVRGALRFVTGSQEPKSYTIRTPVGSLGVRGTIIDLVKEGDLWYVILVSGALSMTYKGSVYNLTQAGTAFVISDGGITGPVTWDGTILNTGADVPFPLYGWYFPGQPVDGNQSGINIGSIDQLNGVIQRQLMPPPTIPPPSNSYYGPGNSR